MTRNADFSSGTVPWAESKRFRQAESAARLDDSGDLVAQAVVCAKRGDADAVRFLYVRYADHVYGYLRGVVRDDAEEVTRMVFARLVTLIGRHDEHAQPFSAWILRVAHDAATGHVRARRALPA